MHSSAVAPSGMSAEVGHEAEQRRIARVSACRTVGSMAVRHCRLRDGSAMKGAKTRKDLLDSRKSFKRFNGRAKQQFYAGVTRKAWKRRSCPLDRNASDEKIGDRIPRCCGSDEAFTSPNFRFEETASSYSHDDNQHPTESCQMQATDQPLPRQADTTMFRARRSSFEDKCMALLADCCDSGSESNDPPPAAAATDEGGRASHPWGDCCDDSDLESDGSGDSDYSSESGRGDPRREVFRLLLRRRGPPFKFRAPCDPGTRSSAPDDGTDDEGGFPARRWG